MKRHIAAWLAATAFVWAGFVVAGCEPEKTAPSKNICKQADGSWKEC